MDREVLSRAVKTQDLEVHVSTVRTEHGVFTDIREYVPSLEAYGRGVIFPAALTKEIKAGLTAVNKK